MKREVTITFLELRAGDPVSYKGEAPDGFELRRAQTVQPELNRFLYATVGGAWYWVDRLEWTHAQWEELLQREGYETWILSCGGSIAGYFELEGRAAGECEIAYLGLMPQFIGQGLGGFLLSRAIRRCWERGSTRITVNTCTLDHRSALNNYIARGFRPIKEVTVLKELPDRRIDPSAGSM